MDTTRERLFALDYFALHGSAFTDK